MNRPGQFQRACWVLFALLGASQAVRAGGDQREPGVTALLPKYKQECAACHVAFPPGMLPAESWRRLMNNLPRHHGTDASLDATTVNELTTWLSANAGSYRRLRETPPDDRITKSAWFIRKHDEVPAAVWKRPAVKSAANCTACHTQADQGNFNEHTVRIPR
jgi:mono/diheme cytochrome c family protein